MSCTEVMTSTTGVTIRGTSLTGAGGAAGVATGAGAGSGAGAGAGASGAGTVASDTGVVSLLAGGVAVVSEAVVVALELLVPVVALAAASFVFGAALTEVCWLEIRPELRMLVTSLIVFRRTPARWLPTSAAGRVVTVRTVFGRPVLSGLFAEPPAEPPECAPELGSAVAIALPAPSMRPAQSRQLPAAWCIGDQVKVLTPT
jgi:hypothetical protein